MSRSEFRWNKKRKHYAYLHKSKGTLIFNIIISTKPFVLRKGKISIRNISLYRHPDIKKKGNFYLIPRNYLDDIKSFSEKVYNKWNFDKNDKRKVKRIKKQK